MNELGTRFSLFLARDPAAIARDCIDILFVSVVVYAALLLLKATRTLRFGFGIVCLFAGHEIAKRLELVTLQTTLQTVLASLVLIVVVIFQQDIRRALQRFCRSPLLAGRRFAVERQLVDDTVHAAFSLAHRRIGALVVFERDNALDQFIEAGTVLDAIVTRELLYTLFIPSHENPLHDGAVIIRDGILWQAGAFLPLTATPKLDRNLGTRHRAGLGISEETDSVVIVVSEERGEVSLCFHGSIARNLDSTLLVRILSQLFSRGLDRATRNGARHMRVSRMLGSAGPTGSTPPQSSSGAP